jgi:DNA glycosylase AlkZ-like
VADGDLLGPRALNRATLDRQLLLRRHAMPARQAVTHLAGLQAQAPNAPYVGLWTRLDNFAAGDLADLLTEREVVRASLMRATVHLVTPADFAAFRPLLQPLMTGGPFGRNLESVDTAELRAATREHLAERPRTRTELGRLLAARWPEADPMSLAYTATYLVPLVQVPPRGIWGKTGPAAWADAETWLGQSLEQSFPAPPAPSPSSLPSPAAALEHLVLRYLAAFGPASVNDIQTWSGLTRLREVTERLRPGLRVFRDEDGRERLDLPDAPRPDPDIPAPPRFLPEYDNLLLSHADRSRVNPDARPVPLPPGSGGTQGTLLVDGVWNATWKITRDNGATVLHIHPFARLSEPDVAAITAEGARLLAFTAPDSPPDIRITPA